MSDPGTDVQLSADVLVVEDSLTQAARLQQQLSGRGVVVRVARDGQEALELMRGQLPDVVVTDVLMPVLDGYQLCRRINDDAESRHVPVILLTDLREPEDAIRGLEAGASCFLSKPCNIDELVERIQQLQENAQQSGNERRDLALAFSLGGKQHTVTVDQAQIVNLLLSSLDAVLQHRRRLATTNEELSQALQAVESLGHLIVEEQAPPKVGAAGSGLRVLVVEDSPVQAERARFRLAEHGFEVRVAKDGEEGLAMAQAWKPEIVLSDVVMPGMDGYGLCKAIKHDRDLSATQVVMLTGLSDPADIVRGINAGADYYLTKPCTDEHLVSRIEAIAAGRARHPSQIRDRVDTDVDLNGTQYRIRASRKQILDLMLSTYENAVQQNRELQRLKQELEDVNSSLEERVKQKTAELWQAERKYQSLVDNAMDGIFQLDCEGRVLTANPAFAAMLGYAGVPELLADETGVEPLIAGHEGAPLFSGDEHSVERRCARRNGVARFTSTRVWGWLPCTSGYSFSLRR
ncbi:MAG: response regulator [Lentisphaerae bacterium]|nr:response regulator [Lentisphaerota bacterium]